MLVWLWALSMAALVPSPAPAYKQKVRPWRVHEAMTGQAVACLNESRAQARDVGGCPRHRPVSRALERRHDDGALVSGVVLEGAAATMAELKWAVAWSDDPQRNDARVRTTSNFLFAFRLLHYCKGPGKVATPAGLLCASHYGPLQFLHAMRSSQSESAAQTQAKVLDWATFSYAVASGHVRSDAALERALAPYPAIRDDVLSVVRGSLCRPKSGPRATVYSTVGDLFGVERLGVLRSRRCRFRSARDTRLAALGAVLHLVQDSFSQGHATRPHDVQGHEAVVAPSPVERHANYASQSFFEHARTDRWPVTAAGSGGREVDHPVVACAKVLEALASRRPPSAVRSDLASRVFSLD